MAKRICPIHGKWTKTHQQTSCPKCKRTSSREYDKNYRNQESSKFYHSRAWKQARDRQLSKYPLCVECGRPASMVDHIVEIRDGGPKLSPDNLQSMCRSCHNAKTAAERSRRGGAVKSLQPDDQNTGAHPKFSQSPFQGGTP